MAVKTTKEYADRMKMAQALTTPPPVTAKQYAEPTLMGEVSWVVVTKIPRALVGDETKDAMEVLYRGKQYVVRVLPAEPTMQVVIEHDSGVVSTVEFGPLDSKETRVAFILRLVENKVNYSVNFSKE
jgi:hypothetical protein